MGANQTTPVGETSHGGANCFLKEKQLLGVQLLWVRIKQLLGEKHLMGKRIVSLKRNNSWGGGGTAPVGANQTTPGGETSHGGANCFLKEKQLLGVQLLWVRIKQLLGEKHLMG